MALADAGVVTWAHDRSRPESRRQASAGVEVDASAGKCEKGVTVTSISAQVMRTLDELTSVTTAMLPLAVPWWRAATGLCPESARVGQSPTSWRYAILTCHYEERPCRDGSRQVCRCPVLTNQLDGLSP